MLNLRRLLARLLAWAHGMVAEPDPNEPDWTILRSSFERFDDDDWSADATVQTESTKMLVWMMAAFCADAPNFMTGGFSMSAADGRHGAFELTVRRIGPGAKSPQQRIAELEAERDALLATRQAA